MKATARARINLARRLRERREEIEETIWTRVKSISDPSDVADPAYAMGLRAAVTTVIEYGLDALEREAGSFSPVPVSLLAQARLAARNGIPIGTVLRRYFAGYSLLGYFAIEEASRDHLMAGAELQRMVASQAALFDRLLATISEEHRRERECVRAETGGRRQLKSVQRLLDGDPVDADALRYDLNGHHVGIVARGHDAPAALRDLAESLDRSLLLVRPAEETSWAWLGGRKAPVSDAFGQAVAASWPRDHVLAMGEPAAGSTGWRLTHRQAFAAMTVAERGAEPVVRYADVALLASAVKDDLLVTSLGHLYLEPLKEGPDGGGTLRETLSAYLAAGHNASAAAARLGISRQTVGSRLQAAERRLGRGLAACSSELDIALRLRRIQ